MGTWNLKICKFLITSLFSRKRKIIGGKFKFWKSGHELVQTKQWKQKSAIELRLLSCYEDKCKLCALFDNFLCCTSQQSLHIIRQAVYSNMKRYQICPAVPQFFFTWLAVRDFLLIWPSLNKIYPPSALYNIPSTKAILGSMLVKYWLFPLQSFWKSLKFSNGVGVLRK